MCVGPHDFIPAAGVINVQIIFTALGERVENVYNVLSGGGVTLADIHRIRDKFVTFANSNYQSTVSSEARIALVILKDLSAEDGLGEESSILTGWGGIAGGTPLPNNVTVTTKWSTGHIGRSRRGRTYHVGLTNALVSGNQLTPASLSYMQNAYNGLITILGAGGTNDQLVVVSKCGGGEWRPSALVTPITQATIDPNLDSQRRRLAGRGA